MDPRLRDLARFDGALWLEKLGISQAMKEKSVDIALDVQSRTVFYQRARGADLYIIAGWRNQHTNVWVGAAAYQVADRI